MRLLGIEREEKRAKEFGVGIHGRRDFISN
jgi:hypothetical protein